MTNTENDQKRLNQLANYAMAQRELTEKLQRGVATSRQAGASWAEIGEMLGISKQAAQQKYGKTLEELPLSAPEFDPLFTTPQVHTPSIFIDPIEPAKRKTPSKKVDAPAPATNTNGPFRRQYEIPDHDETAQPGIGKGPHQCPACGSTNHKTEHKELAAFTAACKPTKYDPPKIAALMQETNA